MQQELAAGAAISAAALPLWLRLLPSLRLWSTQQSLQNCQSFYCTSTSPESRGTSTTSFCAVTKSSPTKSYFDIDIDELNEVIDAN